MCNPPGGAGICSNLNCKLEGPERPADEKVEQCIPPSELGGESWCDSEDVFLKAFMARIRWWL